MMVKDGETTTSISAILLAGGKSRRLGRDKALENIGGERIIDKVITKVSKCCDEVLVVGDRPARYQELDLPEEIKFVHDHFANAGSLGGLYTGLSKSLSDWCLLVACDMPFLSVDLLNDMKSKAIDSKAHALVPIIDGRFQPTHAFYNKRCLPYIERNIKLGLFKMIGYFNEINVKTVVFDSNEMNQDTERSFFNLNTKEDLQKARQWV